MHLLSTSPSGRTTLRRSSDSPYCHAFRSLRKTTIQPVDHSVGLIELVPKLRCPDAMKPRTTIARGVFNSALGGLDLPRCVFHLLPEAREQDPRLCNVRILGQRVIDHRHHGRTNRLASRAKSVMQLT